MDRLFNHEVKQAYIDNYLGEESTKTTIFYEFVKSAKVERQYNKDLYAFFGDEIEDLAQSLGANNVSSINKSISIYKDYVNWCIVNGQRGVYENGENRIEIFQKTQDLKKYVSNNKVRNKFLTKEELSDLIDALANPMDKAIVLALYEFIAGEKLYELRSLKIGDINEDNNTVTLTDIDGNIRTQTISNELIQYMKDANSIDEYINNNGLSKSRMLKESEYIIRPLQRDDNVNGEMSYGGLTQKIVKIKKYVGYDFITATSLQDTRIIHEIVDVMKQMDLKKPNDEVYDIAVKNIKKLYNVELTINKMYNIKQTVDQLIDLKEF